MSGSEVFKTIGYTFRSDQAETERSKKGKGGHGRGQLYATIFLLTKS